VVSIFASYSEDPCSIPADNLTSFSVFTVLKIRQKINGREAGDGPSINKTH